MQFSHEELIKIVCRSSTIAERLGSGFLSNEAQENDPIVDSRLEQWCQLVADGNRKTLEKRLAWDGLDLSRVCRALGSVRMNDNQYLPAWAETLNEGIKATALISGETLEKGDLEENRFVDTQEPLPFEEAFFPFVYVARQKLIASANSSYHLLSKEAHANLERSLLRWLAFISSRSMELEFSVFRAGKQATLARLLGQSPGSSFREQYREFIKGMLSGGLLSFFQEYSVLARLVGTVTDLWVDATAEFLLRLASDWSEIQKTFPSEIKLGQVTAIRPGLSDSHHNGRSVMAVTFASGLKLIYKPKDLGLEEAYFKLLAWFNKQKAPLPFKLLKVINHSTYGWVEYVEPLPCKNKQEARRYYQLAGMLLCMVYTLAGTDCHFENLIACGEHPVLVDLETLMEHRVREVVDQVDDQEVQYLVSQQVRNSVLRTGLLPHWEIGPAWQSYDVTGLGGVGGQETFLQTRRWKNINTDIMALRYEYVKTQSPDNSPSLDDVSLSPSDYVEEIVDGFRQMYRFLVERRKAILAPNGPLTELAHQRVRFVFRKSKIYSSVLNKTFNPKYLRNGADRSIQLDILSRAMLSSDSKPFLWPLLRAEQQALEQLDIPLFIASSDSDALTVAPNATIEKCFTEPSYDRVTFRLNQLNDEDLERQIGFIRGSLYSYVAGKVSHSSPLENSDLNLSFVSPLTREEIVKHAIVIAGELQKQAIFSSDGSATWLAPQYIIKAQQYQFQLMGYGLYDGCCGVALFLAALEKVTGGAGFRNFTLAALQSLRQNLQVSMSSQIAKNFGIGGALGCGSIIYALVRISQLLEESALLEKARKVASLITPELIATEQNFDIISGAAGAILGLLALHNVFAERDVLKQAIAIGNHLLNNRIASNSGCRAWANSDGKLLTGFSHGAAGIAYALLRLYKITARADFLEAAQEAIAYERSVFIPEVGNWPDFRYTQPEKGFKCMCSWCHGAPGIGLARVAGLEILDTDAIRQDIQAAVDTTRQLNLQGIDHLCCGNLGRVEFLFTAARKLSQPQLLEAAMKQADQVVARAKQRGGFAYGPILNYNPGFFQGAAGIGYELLRLAYPDQLPSVLLWE